MSDDLQLKMILESEVILVRIALIENRIAHQMVELDRIRERGNNYFEEEQSEAELYYLIKILDKEAIKMDEFMDKYKEILKNYEKKKSIRNLREKKQIRLRGFPKDSRRTQGGN
jgi:hypothetical protein